MCFCQAQSHTVAYNTNKIFPCICSYGVGNPAAHNVGIGEAFLYFADKLAHRRCDVAVVKGYSSGEMLFVRLKQLSFHIHIARSVFLHSNTAVGLKIKYRTLIENRHWAIKSDSTRFS